MVIQQYNNKIANLVSGATLLPNKFGRTNEGHWSDDSILRNSLNLSQWRKEESHLRDHHRQIFQPLLPAQ